MNHNQGKVIVAFALPQALLLVIASVAGLTFPDLYEKETPNWLAQSVSQDAIDLFVVAPLLGLSALYSMKGEPQAKLLWGGVNLYLVYTFVIYCFNVHFNKLFIVYWLILGLSFYSFVYFLYSQLHAPAIQSFQRWRPARITAVYFIVVAVLFYLLWMAEIVPALRGGYTPRTVVVAGLFTNPVQVIDLSVFLPGIFIVGVLIFKKQVFGFVMAPVLLVFFILMDITIAAIMLTMYTRGDETNFYVVALMSGLTVFSAVLLRWYLGASEPGMS